LKESSYTFLICSGEKNTNTWRVIKFTDGKRDYQQLGITLKEYIAAAIQIEKEGVKSSSSKKNRADPLPRELT